MVKQKKVYSRLFSKLFLLGIYLAFFSVQLILRYTSSHSLQSLEKISNGRELNSLAHNSESDQLKTAPKKIMGQSYLNKRFHPEYMPSISSDWDEIRTVYCFVGKLNFTNTLHIPAADTGSIILRGPPFCSFDC
jgi:hypothetical protein